MSVKIVAGLLTGGGGSRGGKAQGQRTLLQRGRIKQEPDKDSCRPR